MSKAKFFSNSVIMLDHKDSETILSLKDTRLEQQDIFKVPEHNVGTTNLMIFLDGRLCVPSRDYVDINSSQVKFTRQINIGEDFHSVLIKTSKDTVYIGGDGEEIVVPSPTQWEDF